MKVSFFRQAILSKNQHGKDVVEKDVLFFRQEKSYAGAQGPVVDVFESRATEQHKAEFKKEPKEFLKSEAPAEAEAPAKAKGLFGKKKD